MKKGVFFIMYIRIYFILMSFLVSEREMSSYISSKGGAYFQFFQITQSHKTAYDCVVLPCLIIGKESGPRNFLIVKGKKDGKIGRVDFFGDAACGGVHTPVIGLFYGVKIPSYMLCLTTCESSAVLPCIHDILKLRNISFVFSKYLFLCFQEINAGLTAKYQSKIVEEGIRIV
jgi:hypothetical protein